MCVTLMVATELIFYTCHPYESLPCFHYESNLWMIKLATANQGIIRITNAQAALLAPHEVLPKKAEEARAAVIRLLKLLLVKSSVNIGVFHLSSKEKPHRHFGWGSELLVRASGSDLAPTAFGMRQDGCNSFCSTECSTRIQRSSACRLRDTK